jgi:phosphohistidine phosphatase
MRAKQTAETLANGLKPFNDPVESVQGLNPNDDIRPWASRIFKENEDLMIVGHLPFLEKLCSFLLAGDENGRLVLFRYGAIVCLEQKEDKRWAVTWVLTPEMTTSQ